MRSGILNVTLEASLSGLCSQAVVVVGQLADGFSQPEPVPSVCPSIHPPTHPLMHRSYLPSAICPLSFCRLSLLMFLWKTLTHALLIDDLDQVSKCLLNVYQA